MLIPIGDGLPIKFYILGILSIFIAIVSFVSLSTGATILYNPNLINCTKGIFGWWLTGCTVNPIDLGNITQGAQGPPGANGTFDNTTVYIGSLNISGILYIGQNRSAFPISCSNNQFLSSLGSNGIFICTTPVIYNVSYELMYNASYLTSDVEDWTNVAFLNTSQNWTANQNFTQSIWVGKNLNVTGNTTLGNATIEYLNVSGQLFVGVNRSSFPITCSAGQFVSSLGSNGIFACSTPTSSSADFTNVAFLNNTQNFTAQNTFRDLIVIGWLNVTNQTVFTTLNNVTSKGYFNATGFNATGNSIFGNVNVSGSVNASGSNNFLGSTNVSGNFNVTGNITGGVVYSNTSQTLTYSEGMRLLCSNNTASSQGTLDCFNLPVFRQYLLLVFIEGSSASQNFNLRFNQDTTAGAYTYNTCYIGGRCTTSSSSNTIQLENNATTNSRMINCYINNDPGDSITTYQCNIGLIGGSGNPPQVSSGGWTKATTQITSFDIVPGSGTINTNSTMKVYGVI